jgi:hypothetical protein
MHVTNPTGIHPAHACAVLVSGERIWVTNKCWRSIAVLAGYGEDMSVTHAPMLTAVAFQLSAALESYQMNVDALTDPWSQRRQYELVSHAFDDVRMLKGALPDLSVLMVEISICHVELMKALWLAGTSRESHDPAALQELRERHRELVSVMRERCLKVFSRE